MANIRHATFMVLFIFLLSSTVNANHVADHAVTENPGITPDSFIWGLDRALENIALLLTFDKGKKAEKGLEIARERLLEVKVMIEENKLSDAENAQEEHRKTLIKVKNSIKNLEKDNSTEELEKELEIEKVLEEHEDNVEKINTGLKVKIKIEGAITEEQKTLINSILDSLTKQTGEVKIEIKNKKDKIKIKIKQETGKSDDEIENEIKDLEEKIGLEEIEVKAEITGDKTQIKIENEFSTIAIEKDAIINEIIKKFVLNRETVDKMLKIETDGEIEGDRLKIEAKTKDGITEVEIELRFILNATDREAIISEVVARSQLSNEDIEKVIELKAEKEEKEAEELEIKVEIEDDIAEVRIEIGDNEQRFKLKTIDKEVILSEIALRLNVKVEDIKAFVKFEIKKEKTGTDAETKGKKENSTEEDKKDDKE